VVGACGCCPSTAARVAEFFDVAAGAGAGGVLAAMLFLRSPDGRPRYSAAEALSFVSGSVGWKDWDGGRRGWWAKLFRGGADRPLRRVFGDATLRDTVAPLLVPCYDLSTAAPFMFSRADAVESDAFNFRLHDVCVATCTAHSAPAPVRSVDGVTAIAAASASLRSSSSASCSRGSITTVPTRELARITASGIVDTVDEAVAMAFRHTCGSNYVRIQAGKSRTRVHADTAAEGMLAQRNVESVLFVGRRLSERTNAEKVDTLVTELVKEKERRRHSPLLNVAIKQVDMPWLSSATTTASSVTTPGTASTMPSPLSCHSRR
jgi:hypothetical protein